MRLREKLILTFIVVVFVPILIVGVYLTNELREDALNDAIEQSVLNVERVNQRTVEILKVPVFVSNNLMFDQRLNSLVNTSFQHTHEVVEAYRNYNDFSHYRQYYPEIASIRFYMENETMINNWELIPVDEQVAQRPWYKEAASDARFMKWYFLPDETKSNQPYLSLVRRINFLDHETFGVLVITIKPALLNWMLNQEEYLTMIIDEHHNVVASNETDKIGGKLNKIIQEKEGKQNGAIFEGIVDGESSQVIGEEIIVDELSQNKLQIMSVVNNHHIVGNANTLAAKGAVVTFIGVIIAIVLIASVSHLLSKRISTLSTHIKTVSQGNLETEMTIDGKDEIGELSQQFNQMVISLKESIEEVHETSRQKAHLLQSQNDIKLKMMASQINPHFLFNTLESIRMKAHMEGAKEAAGIVKLLGKLMRKSIETGGRQIPLQQEVEMVRCYLDIQKFRYENRLAYELIIDPDSANIQINPLIIQPLVENAVIHGLEDKEAGGRVIVETKRDHQKVTVKVIDDGKGFTKQRLKEVQAFIEETEDEARIGLRNVHQRLLLTYGPDAGLVISSEPGGQTIIQFTIPIKEE